MSLAHKTGTAPAGVNNTRKMPCTQKPATHGFHPSNEACPYCPAIVMPVRSYGQILEPGKWFTYKREGHDPQTLYPYDLDGSREVTAEEWSSGNWYQCATMNQIVDANYYDMVLNNVYWTRLP